MSDWSGLKKWATESSSWLILWLEQRGCFSCGLMICYFLLPQSRTRQQICNKLGQERPHKHTQIKQQKRTIVFQFHVVLFLFFFCRLNPVGLCGSCLMLLKRSGAVKWIHRWYWRLFLGGAGGQQGSGYCSFSRSVFNGTLMEKKWHTVVTNHLNPNQAPVGGWFKSMFVFYCLLILNLMWTTHLKVQSGLFIHSRRRGNQNVNTNWLLCCRNTTTFSFPWSFCHADRFELIWKCVGSTWALLCLFLIYFFMIFYS